MIIDLRWEGIAGKKRDYFDGWDKVKLPQKRTSWDRSLGAKNVVLGEIWLWSYLIEPNSFWQKIIMRIAESQMECTFSFSFFSLHLMQSNLSCTQCIFFLE